MRPQLLILLVCLLILGAANFWPHYLSEDLDIQADTLAACGKKAEAREVYEQELKKHPDDPRLCFNYIDACEDSDKVDHLLQPLVYNLKTRDKALLCQGYARMTLKHDLAGALERFSRVHDQRLLNLHLLTGDAFKKSGRLQQALPEWRQEIAAGGNLHAAVARLARYYSKHGPSSELRALLENPVTGPYFSQAARIVLAEREGNWLLFMRLSVADTLGQGAVPLTAALLIALMWLIFLKRIDVFEPEPAWALLLAFGLGCLGCICLTMPLHQLMDWLDPRIGDLSAAEAVAQDPLFAIHVGLVEETIKLLPVLLLAACSRELNEPVDWLIYGSASALGFATVENIDYFTDNAYANVMLLRFTSCVIIHMTLTSLICYAWTRTRHIRGRSALWASGTALLGFGLAAVYHGLYDFMDTDSKHLLALLLALLYGRMLANALSCSPFFDDPVKARAGLRNDQLIECTALLMLLMPYIWWDLTASTALANDWLASNAWSWFLVLTYFSSVEFISLSRQRELWFSLPEEEVIRPASASERCLQLLRAVLVLTGVQSILTAAFPGQAGALTLLYSFMLMGVFWVYFRGAYGGVRSPLQWLAPAEGRGQLEDELVSTGFGECTLPARDGRIRALLALAAGPLLLGAALVAISYVLTQGRHTLPLAVPMLLLTAPVAWVRPSFQAAWRHSSLPTWAWIYRRAGRSACMLWSRLPDGELITSADLSPWLVRPASTRLQIFPKMTLAQLLERHQQAADGLQAEPTRGFVQDFGEHVAGVQGAFLAAPIRHTVRAVWRALSRQRYHRRPVSEQGQPAG